MPKTKMTTRRTLPKDERRTQILQAARRVFSERGYHATSVSDIATQCGIAQGTLYLHFSGKEALFAALLGEFAMGVYQVFFVPGAESVVTENEVATRLFEAGMRATAYLEQNRDLARIFLVDGGVREPVLEEHVNTFFSTVIAENASNLRRWRDAGLLRPIDPDAVAVFILGIIERLTLQWLNGALPGTLTDTVHEAITFELYAILKHPAETLASSE